MPIKTSKKNSSSKMLPDYMIWNSNLLIADLSSHEYFARGVKPIKETVFNFGKPQNWT